jgi:hypothetical protein
MILLFATTGSLIKLAYRVQREAKMTDKRVSVTGRLRIFNRAVRRKSSRYILSGLVVIGIGCIVIAFGLLLIIGTSVPLVAGLGVIVVLVGIIRVLIGLINPAHPDDLPPEEEEPKNPEEELHEAIFDKDVLA